MVNVFQLTCFCFLIRCTLGALPDDADLFQTVLVDEFDLSAVDSDELLVGKLREGADGVARRHVGEAGQIFTREVDAQRKAILLYTVALLEHHQRFGQTTADMLLRQVDGALVGDALVNGDATHKEATEADVLVAELVDCGHGDEADDRSLERGSRGDVILFGEIGAVTEVLHWFHHADNLTAASYAVLEDFHLATKQTHHMGRRFTLEMNHLISLVTLNNKLTGEILTLFGGKRLPHIGNHLGDVEVDSYLIITAFCHIYVT